jgi:hypothetical protein
VDKIEYILHIGLPKTGTTFLQYEIFPKIQNVNYGTPDKGIVLEHFKPVDGKINIYSNENILGVSTTNNLLYYRLRDIFEKYPQLKIIVCLRDTDSWLPSLYNQYVRSGGTERYYMWVNHLLNKDYLDRRFMITMLENFCKELLVLDFNNLKYNPDMFVNKICSFIGVPMIEYTNKTHGKSLPKWAICILRFTNHFIILGKVYRYFRIKKNKERLG